MISILSIVLLAIVLLGVAVMDIIHNHPGFRSFTFGMVAPVWKSFRLSRAELDAITDDHSRVTPTKEELENLEKEIEAMKEAFNSTSETNKELSEHLTDLRIHFDNKFIERLVEEDHYAFWRRLRSAWMQIENGGDMRQSIDEYLATQDPESFSFQDVVNMTDPKDARYVTEVEEFLNNGGKLAVVEIAHRVYNRVPWTDYGMERFVTGANPWVALDDIATTPAGKFIRSMGLVIHDVEPDIDEYHSGDVSTIASPMSGELSVLLRMNVEHRAKVSSIYRKEFTLTMVMDAAMAEKAVYEANVKNLLIFGRRFDQRMADLLEVNIVGYVENKPTK